MGFQVMNLTFVVDSDGSMLMMTLPGFTHVSLQRLGRLESVYVKNDSVIVVLWPFD